MSARKASWQLPEGVAPGVWDYAQSEETARIYEASLAGSALWEADQAFVQKHFRNPGRVIDLGCGTGRSLLPLAQRGFWCVGVDLSAPMVQQAAARAESIGVALHLIQGNIVHLDVIASNSFDYALCLFSTLGMVAGARARQRVLAEAYRLLKPGGLLLLHGHNRWFNAWTPAGRAWVLRDVIRTILGRADQGDHPMPAHQGSAGWTMHLFRRNELQALCQNAGFTIVEIQPVGLSGKGDLHFPWWFPRLRAYGNLIAARKEDERS